MELILAIIIGGAFGFVLDRVGATNPNYIINMLRLKDLHLMKVILLAIGFSSMLVFAGIALGLVDAGHLSVKDAYWGVFVGGAILGVGFAVAGYCPGTGLTAAAAGRKDAIVFAIGGLLGAFAYMLTYEHTKAMGLLEKLWGGKVTVGTIPGDVYPGLLDFSGILVGIILGGIIALIAWKLPSKK